MNAKHSLELMYVLGQNLFYLRNAKGWTLRATRDVYGANGIGLSLGKLSQLEKGKAMITIETLSKLANFWGIAPAVLISSEISQRIHLFSKDTPLKAATFRSSIKPNKFTNSW